MVEGSTGDLLLDAAERLVAQRGPDGVSLRDVGRAAGQRNNSAAQYHFGTREQLLRAVAARRLTGVEARRHAMVDALEANGATTDVRELVRALVVPFAELLEDPASREFPRFVAQVFTAPQWSSLIDAELFGGRDRVRAHLRAALAHLPEPVVERRLALASVLYLHALVDREVYLDAGVSGDRLRTPIFVATIVDAMVALLGGPVSPEALADADDAPWARALRSSTVRS